jgi:hypothetical protein
MNIPDHTSESLEKMFSGMEKFGSGMCHLDLDLEKTESQFLKISQKAGSK